jgi:hypothetical protein
MNRKKTVQKDRKTKLALKKETLKDLGANRNVVGGGFIMKDTVIIKTSGR